MNVWKAADEVHHLAVSMQCAVTTEVSDVSGLFAIEDSKKQDNFILFVVGDGLQALHLQMNSLKKKQNKNE